MAMSYRETNELNARWWDAVHTRGHEKIAEDILTDFTRTTLREGCLINKIIPPITITAEDYDRRVENDMPYYVVDKEPESPAAVSVSFGTQSESFMLNAPRYPIYFYRIFSPQRVADEASLRSYTYDIRKVTLDNMLKDMLAERDAAWFLQFNRVLWAADTVSPFSGSTLWRDMNGPLTRDSLADGKKIMVTTPYNLQAGVAVANIVTMFEMEKFTRDEYGGDGSEDLFVNGFTLQKLNGIKWIFTIKRGVVPDGVIYRFADPSFIGKNVEFSEPVAFVERKLTYIRMGAYQELGGGIGHSAGISREDYQIAV